METTDRRLQIMTCLWLAEPFVAQPRIGSQRLEWKILRPFPQGDLVNVDGFRAMAHQDFLSLGFLFRGSDAHPDQQALRFGKLLQSLCAFALQAPPRPQNRHAGYNDPAQNCEDADRNRLHPLRDKIKRYAYRGSAAGDAADDGVGANHIVSTHIRLP